MDKVKLFRELFKGREDAYGFGNGLCIKEPVTEALIGKHLRGEKRIGIYNFSPDIENGTATLWSCYDIDNHEKDRSGDEVFADVVKIQKVYAELGLQAHIEASKSDESYHLWKFNAEPLPGEIERKLATLVAEKAGVSRFEFFPKQKDISQTEKDENGNPVTKHGYGNYVNLPLNGPELVTQGRTVFLDPDDNYNPYPDQFEFLSKVHRHTRSEIEAALSKLEPQELIEAETEATTQKQGDAPKVQKPTATKSKLNPANMLPVLLEKCAFMAEFKDGTGTHSEELWYRFLTNIVTYEGGDDKAYELSKKSPKFDEGTTRKKIAHATDAVTQGLAPHTCEKIFGVEGWTSKVCDTCIAKAASPASLPLLLRKRDTPTIQDEPPPEKTVEPTINIDEILYDDDFFLKPYMEFCNEITDAPKVFSFFCGISTVATALGNRTSVAWGSDYIFPNVWLLLIAASTRSRKSYSIATSKKICHKTNEVIMGPVMAEYLNEKDTYEALSKEEQEGHTQPISPATAIQILADEFTTEGLLDALDSQPSGTMVWSEVATALQQMRKTYMAGTREMLTAIYDCPYIYERKLKTSHYKVNRPCLSLLAATTLEWFCEAITETDLQGGLLPRFLYVPSKEIMPFMAYPQLAGEDKQQYLIKTLAEVYEISNKSLVFSDDAKDFFIDWSTENDMIALALTDGAQLAAFYHRLQIVLVKLSMIIHQQKLRNTNEIDLYTMGQAVKITEYLREAATYMVRGQMTFSTDQATRKKILTIITEAGSEGITKSKLTRHAHLRVKELSEFTEWLAQEGSIRIVETGKNQIRYFSP